MKPFVVNLVAERLHVDLHARRMTNGQVPSPVTLGTSQPPTEPLERGQEVLLAAAEQGEVAWVAGRVIRGHSADLLVDVTVACAGLLDGSALSVPMATSRRYLFLRHEAQVVALGDRMLVSLRHGPSSMSAHNTVRCRTDIPCRVAQRDPESGRFISFTSRTVDMSPVGACVRVNAPLTMGEQCSLVLDLAGPAVHVPGIVVGTSQRFARITFRDLKRDRRSRSTPTSTNSCTNRRGAIPSNRKRACKGSKVPSRHQEPERDPSFHPPDS